MSESDERYAAVERELAFAAISEWDEETLVAMLTEALERYCDHCRSLKPIDRLRKQRVLLDIDLWVDPREAAMGRPLGGAVEGSAQALARGVRSGRMDLPAILSTLARECAK